MPDPFVEIRWDQHKLAALRQQFRHWPQAVPRIMKESINSTSDKARTSLVRRISQYVKGIRAKDIRSRIKQTKATLSRWESTLEISGKGLPISKLGMKQGRTKKVKFTASARHSVWLYYNVFKPLYGDAAIFSWHYRISRRSFPNITYQVMGQTRKVADRYPNAFIQKMPTGHKGAYVTREGYGGKALRELYGPGLGTMLEAQKGELDAVKNEAMATLDDNINRRVARYLEMMQTRRAG